MKGYLTPFTVQKELEKIQDKGSKTADYKYRERVKKWREEYMTKVEGITADDDDDEDDDGNDSELEALGADDENKKDDEDSDEEYAQDVNFIDLDDIIVKYGDLDQELKGYDPYTVGKVMSVGEKYQSGLKEREFIDEEPEEDDAETASPENAGGGGFLAQQRAEMEKKKASRDDKHLLPHDKWVPPKECDYGHIDLIFNSKNIWANLQHHDPCRIYYHLHDDTQWLPFVADDIYPSKWDSGTSPEPLVGDKGKDEVMKFKKWQKFIEMEKMGGPIGNIEIDENDPKANVLDKLE